MMAVAAQLWQSKMFMDKQMVAWENKTTEQQTWVVPQTYLTKKMGGTQTILHNDGKTIAL
jgi:hypothetical protein